jgi:hypothetical protein
MKRLILALGVGAALILAGCNKGGTSDQYGTSSGNASGNTSNSMQNGSGANGANGGANNGGNANPGH